jgi:hypothetical protein
MKNITILILLFSFCLAFANEQNSTATKQSVPFKRIVEKERNYKSAAPIISVFVPGGGHFYLGNTKTGIVYGLTRFLLIPGYKLWIDNFRIFSSSSINKTESNLGVALMAIGMTSWIVDIIHAGISAKNYEPEIQNNKLSYGIISDPKDNKYGVSLNYTFK